MNRSSVVRRTLASPASALLKCSASKPPSTTATEPADLPPQKIVLGNYPIAGILSIDEGTYVDGRWVPGRRLNGDENGQGKFLRLGGGNSRNGSVQRVKLYRYR
jgi:hypothetical protein